MRRSAWICWLMAMAMVVSVACGDSGLGTQDDGGTDSGPDPDGSTQCDPGTADCDGDPTNGCETTLGTVDHCSGCNDACGDANGTATCDNDQCQLTCDAGYADCDSDASNGCETELGTLTDCTGCADTCDETNATATCDATGCGLTCDGGFADCDTDPNTGCETALGTLTDCLSCGDVCDETNATATCDATGCSLACDPGYADCDTDPTTGCEITLGTLTDCMACGDVCPDANATASCDATGVGCSFVCSPGFADCDGDPSNGCEADLGANPNCGGCGVLCTGACLSGACEVCDTGLLLDSVDPLEAASAIGICGGVVSAAWVLPDGSPAPADPDYPTGHGIIDDFGPNVSVQEGSSMLILSTGSARRPTDPDYGDTLDKGYPSTHPTGFPVEDPACGGAVTGAGYDGVALELTLQVPTAAVGFEFDYDFYVRDFPQFVCSAYNDHFLALVDPAPAGSLSGDVAFDSLGNPISLNSAQYEVCGCATGPPCPANGKTYACPLGTAELVGTGFDAVGNAGAATSWLAAQSTAPQGTVTIRFTIYDAGDGIGDSSVLIDNFRWLSQ